MAKTSRTESYTKVVNGRTVRVSGYERTSSGSTGSAAGSGPYRPAMAATQGTYPDPSPLRGRPPVKGSVGKFPNGRSTPFPREAS